MEAKAMGRAETSVFIGKLITSEYNEVCPFQVYKIQKTPVVLERYDGGSDFSSVACGIFSDR